MYGSVVAWLYERVAGLDLSELYRREIHIKPYFMDRLPWAKAQKKTDFGEASVSWMRKDDGYQLQILVPAGLTAKCYFPADCKRLKNAQTGEIFDSDEKGYFNFSLGAGQWNLKSDEIRPADIHHG